MDNRLSWIIYRSCNGPKWTNYFPLLVEVGLRMGFIGQNYYLFWPEGLLDIFPSLGTGPLSVCKTFHILILILCKAWSFIRGVSDLFKWICSSMGGTIREPERGNWSKSFGVNCDKTGGELNPCWIAVHL